MNSKKIAAAVMALVLSCGAMQTTGYFSDDIFSASAAEEQTFDKAVFDEAAGTLTLKGNVSADDIKSYGGNEKVKTVIASEGTVMPEDCSAMFLQFKAEKIDLSKADTSKVKSMARMFYECSELASLDISSFNTANVTDMNSMFYKCTSLKGSMYQSLALQR